MKNLMLFASLLLSTSAFATGPSPVTKDVTIGVSEVFVPGGFSSAMDAYVIESGMFPNSCYRWARADVVHINALLHEVRSVAAVSQTMCLMVLVPFQKEVALGRLLTGEHTIRFVNGDGTFFEKTMTVE